MQPNTVLFRYGAYTGSKTGDIEFKGKPRVVVVPGFLFFM